MTKEMGQNHANIKASLLLDQSKHTLVQGNCQMKAMTEMDENKICWQNKIIKYYDS